jgi:hypothetical protein
MISIYNDTEKTQLIKTLAETVGGLTGAAVGEAVTYAALWIGWSLWEAKTDWNALVNGENVPLLKSAEEWKTGLEGFVKQATSEGLSELTDSTETTGQRGLSYVQYTKLLLCFSSTETIEGRLQNLIFLENDGRDSLSRYVTEFSVKGGLRVGANTYAFSGIYGY